MHGCVASTTTTSRPLMAISAAGHQRVPTGPNRPGRPASVAFANAPFTSFSFSFSPASPSLSRSRRVSRSPSPLPFAPPSSLSAPVPFHLHASYLSTLFCEDYSRWCNNVFTRRTCRVIPTVLPDRTRPLPRDLMAFCVTRRFVFETRCPLMIYERIVRILLLLTGRCLQEHEREKRGLMYCRA